MTIEQATGAVAPVVTLQAIGHRREVAIASVGAPAVLMFVGRETQSAVDPVVDAVRERYPEASQVTILNIADVRGIPRLVRKVAETIMKSSYRERVAKLKPGQSPEEYVLILPDWDGDVFKALGVGDVSKTIFVAVLDRSGRIAGQYQGDDPAGAAVELLGRIAK
jgi:hypothetical protein